MTYKITHKNSTVSGTPPAGGDIDVGEIAINAADAELYVKDTNGNIRKFQNTTTGTAAGVRFTQTGTGAVQRTVESKLQDVVSVKDFGAAGNGAADDTAYIQAAINHAQLTLSTVHFPAGIYKISQTLNINSNPVHLLGETNAVWQQGSQRPAVTLEWHGGAAPMFSVGVSNVGFEGFAAENKGSATDFVEITSGIRYRFHRCSFLVGSGASAFSRAICYSNGTQMGYSTFSSIQVGGSVAPKFLYVVGSTGGLTPITFTDRCIFESGETIPLTVIDLQNVSCDSLIIEKCTFNQQGAQLTIVDTTNTPVSQTVATLSFRDNEWDCNTLPAAATTDRMMRLENVDNVSFVGNHFQCGGAVLAAVELTNTRVTEFQNNYVQAVPVFFNGDGTSYVNVGYNNYVVGNVAKLVNNDIQGYQEVAQSATVYILPQLVDQGKESVFVYEVTSATPWYFAIKTDDNVGYASPGQIITVLIKNTSGGSITYNSVASNIKLAGSLLPLPADGHSRSITFFYDGTNFIELRRGATDVPN